MLLKVAYFAVRSSSWRQHISARVGAGGETRGGSDSSEIYNIIIRDQSEVSQSQHYRRYKRQALMRRRNSFVFASSVSTYVFIFDDGSEP